jgi:histidine triad (HIT) family protein
MNDCSLCLMARGGLRADTVYQDDLVLAFMDKEPIRPGHTLIIPREHIPYFEDLPEATANRMIEVGQRLARGMKRRYEVPRVAFLFTGGDIAHAHAHVVPMHDKTDITSRRYIAEDELTFTSMPRAPTEQLAEEAAQLRLLTRSP